jgi:hypothetical protein
MREWPEDMFSCASRWRKKWVALLAQRECSSLVTFFSRFHRSTISHCFHFFEPLDATVLYLCSTDPTSSGKISVRANDLQSPIRWV